ncbi:NB-ARC domain-containing protein [Micromonospora rosaria]|uniref:NB-ARC domain-containing protein n=1 Tax=Micromonospora rosaria TaxID=47874 RepID=UPI0014710DB6|nr:NB-ARC domain-containing protein [Micromonospora rosaria]
MAEATEPSPPHWITPPRYAWPLSPVVGVPPPRPAQLPPFPASFVGRRAQFSEAAALSTGRTGAPLLLSGQVGVGKTAFALRLAQEQVTALPDGELYADLGGSGAARVDPGAVLAAFLQALGVPADQVPSDVAPAAALYRSLMAQRRMLVLLDDAADEAQLRQLLVHSHSTVVLVTSRSRLLGLDGMHRIHLEPLPRPESVALLLGLVGGRRTSAEPAAAGHIAELCADLPLALDVAGRRIAAHPTWPLTHLVDHLGDRQRLLDRLRVGDLSVRDRLASAFRRLQPAAREALALLAARDRGSVSRAGLGVPADVGDDMVETLVDSGLLQYTPIAGRFRLPPLVRLFVTEQRCRRDHTGSAECVDCRAEELAYPRRQTARPTTTRRSASVAQLIVR